MIIGVFLLSTLLHTQCILLQLFSNSVCFIRIRSEFRDLILTDIGVEQGESNPRLKCGPAKTILHYNAVCIECVQCILSSDSMSFDPEQTRVCFSRRHIHINIICCHCNRSLLDINTEILRKLIL